MKKFTLTITRSDDEGGDDEPTTIFIHDIGENEADAHRLIHELTRPKRVYTKRTAKSAS